MATTATVSPVLANEVAMRSLRLRGLVGDEREAFDAELPARPLRVRARLATFLLKGPQ